MERLIQISEIDKLYSSYGFEINTEYSDVRVYLYKKSRYYGAEIIPLKDDAPIQEKANSIKKEYSALGFATTLRVIKHIEEADLELFKSFFSYDATLSRLNRKYEQFVKKQTRHLLGNEYQYIESPFEVFNDVEPSGKIFNQITEIINGNSSNLIIIEASAGFGKTCTAYELLKILIENDNPRIPIFTELSRNRGAKIFRYILLDEIDTEFSSLNSELVVGEIKKGRIPLIIDGFDELLDKVLINNIESDTGFDEVETMLDTIGNLLESNAKVILTTRKTAIFNGVEFDRWLSKWNNKFSVARFSIQEPRIKDWLGTERFGIVKDNNVPIQYIANPVILTYLKNLTIEEFSTEITNPSILTKHYFDKMLDRERERQNLIISVDEQYEIFKNVVKLLLDFDITSESKEFFKEIIKDQNYKLLEYTRTLYTGSDKPSVDNLVDTLATHALLDRKGRDENQIGFINDFVLGTFIGDIICESKIEKIEKDYSNYMIELSVTAYKVQSQQKKSILWEKLMGLSNRFQSLYIFYFDIVLKEELHQNYLDLYLDDMNFYDISFDKFEIKNTVFFNCLFKRCRIDISLLHGISFIDCTFDFCQVLNGDTFNEGGGITAINCKQENCHILPVRYDLTDNDKQSELSKNEIDILREIMRISQTKGQHIMQLLHCFDKQENRKILKALTELEAKGFVEIRGNHIYPNINKMESIKQIIRSL